ncbi:DUF6174 domain-containing protein [Deinococcus altitudinis]|uniref:DUF6174 domain-containing protein n=1 Tax=Deinococcus altitudinis TaxID=468914 RepID=UPI00389121A6
MIRFRLAALRLAMATPRLATLTLALTTSALAGGAGGPAAPVPGRSPVPNGCVPGFVQPSPAALSRDLVAAQARWKASGALAYRFDFEQIAQPVRYPKTRIEVTGGSVRATALEEGDPSVFAAKASAQGLFLAIRQSVASARTSPCTELKVTYAPDGHPLSFSSQLQTPATANGMADGGASWTVSNFRKR